MDKIMSVLTPVLNIIEAILLLICAFIVASIVKRLVLRLLAKTKLRAQLYKDVAEGKAADGEATQTSGEPVKGNESNAAEFISALIYLIVFLLFIPAIFSLLGIRNASRPLMSIFDSFWDHLPNILACIVILVVGFMLAKLVRQLLIPIFRRLKVDKLQEKAGVETTDKGKLSSTLAYIIYVLILIPIIITALRALRIPAIAGPSISMLSKIFDYVPSIIVTILIIVIGNVIAKFAGQIVTRLIDAGGLDEKIARLLGTSRRNFSLSRIVGTIVHIVILVFFVVQSFGVLHLEVLNNIGNAIISYLPYALSALLILAVCYFAAHAAEKAVSKIASPTLGKIVYFGVWVIGIFMTLNQLGIARSLVETAFMAIIGAFAIAVAIAFGVGGKDFAARALDRLEKENKKNKTETPEPEGPETPEE